MSAKNLIQGATGPWEIVVGCEVHAQVSSNAKLFSGASAEFGGAPNTHVSLVDAGMPGMLPTVNGYCIEQAVKTGLGLKAKVNKHSVFERKNYFYPDLPTGYQISQFAEPIVGSGALSIDFEDGSSKEIGITRLHLEMDAGKSVHDQRADATLIDLNRAGVALMEIVSEPDIRSSEEAVLYMRKLHSILRYLGTCDGNMEEGSLRCDANVSVRRPGAELGTRAEIKNLNSMRFVGRAIDYEARRQIELIEAGETVVQETRLYDSERGETRPMRSKEEAHDYRYFPDPDLLPVVLQDDFIEKIRAELPELPDAKRERFVEKLGVGRDMASVLVADKATADYFEAAAEGRDAKLVANWITTDLFGHLNREGVDIEQSPVAAGDLGGLTELIADNTISGKIAKSVFQDMIETGEPPDAIVERKGLKQISDTGAIEQIIAEIVEANPAQVEKARENPKLISWFVGQVMQKTKGQANPQMVNELLRKALGT